MEVHTVSWSRFLRCADDRLRHVCKFANRNLHVQASGTATNFASRCFGDKGDVEDITEGNYPHFSHPRPHGVNLAPCALTNTRSLADIISTVEFDHTGNYLATGDKGGRVVLFERNETVASSYLFC